MVKDTQNLVIRDFRDKILSSWAQTEVFLILGNTELKIKKFKWIFNIYINTSQKLVIAEHTKLIMHTQTCADRGFYQFFSWKFVSFLI